MTARATQSNQLDMPLKVLLADDSAAIKKVVQLSLQDFGVELKSVNSGKDVMSVAKSFKPDIAFVDVLLPHKTGYDIAKEFKKDSALKNTPIVMLWSSFMSFDEKKYKECGAEDKLEKPFDVTHIRTLVNKYVPKTQASPIAKHLEFPKLEFDFVEGSFNAQSFEDIDYSKTIEELKNIQPQKVESKPADKNTDAEWVRKDLGKYQVAMPENENVAFQYTDEIKNTDFLLKPNAPLITPVTENPISAVSQEEIRKMIQDVIWKIVPDIATNLIKEELQRLMSEDKK